MYKHGENDIYFKKVQIQGNCLVDSARLIQTLWVSPRFCVSDILSAPLPVSPQPQIDQRPHRSLLTHKHTSCWLCAYRSALRIFYSWRRCFSIFWICSFFSSCQHFPLRVESHFWIEQRLFQGWIHSIPLVLTMKCLSYRFELRISESLSHFWRYIGWVASKIWDISCNGLIRRNDKFSPNARHKWWFEGFRPPTHTAKKHTHRTQGKSGKGGKGENRSKPKLRK